ncbi:MAG: acetylxylan esterase [Phycisphaerae bacterium]|nr:acetylxylan esterase [Phycisphaerae bacterium]
MEQRICRSLAAGAVTSVLMFAGCAPRYSGPWDLSKLKQTPAVEWGQPDGLVRPLYYANEPYHGHPTRVFAYYAAPREAKHNAPGMVLVHGGGGKAFSEWADLWAKRGYAAIAMDLAGRGPDGQRLPDAGPDQDHASKFDAISGGIRQAWSYHAVAAIVRAHSLLRILPEVDPNRTGITGISWGGYLTCIAAGLDDRFKVAVPVYGCGFLHEDDRWSGLMRKLSPADRQQWIDDYDPSRYLPGCRIPILFLNGTNDLAYRLDCFQKSYQLVAGPRTVCVTTDMKHSHPHGWAPKEIGIFVDSVLRDGKPLAQLGRVSRHERMIEARVRAEVPIRKAALICTTDGGDWKQRRWQSLPARIEEAGSIIRAELPVDQGIAYFINVIDDRGATVSTEHRSVPDQDRRNPE